MKAKNDFFNENSLFNLKISVHFPFKHWNRLKFTSLTWYKSCPAPNRKETHFNQHQIRLIDAKCVSINALWSIKKRKKISPIKFSNFMAYWIFMFRDFLLEHNIFCLSCETSPCSLICYAYYPSIVSCFSIFCLDTTTWACLIHSPLSSLLLLLLLLPQKKNKISQVIFQQPKMSFTFACFVFINTKKL